MAAARRPASFAPPPVPALEFLERLAKGPLPGVVVLAGEEPFLAAEVLDALRRRRFPDGDPGGGVADFDVTIPEEAERAAAALDELRTGSLFGEGKLVVVRNLGSGRGAAASEEDDGEDGDGAAEEGESEARDTPAAAAAGAKPVRRASPITELVKRAAGSPPGATLAIVTPKPVKGRGSVSAEAITRTGAVLVDCRRLYDSLPPWSRGGSPEDVEVVRFALRRAHRVHGKRLSPDAGALLAERLGSNLSAIAQALETLSAYAGERATLEAKDVVLLVGEARDEPSWAFADAVMERDLPAALGFLDAVFERGLSDSRGRSVSRPEAIFPMLSGALHAAFRRVLLVAEARARGEDPRGLGALAGLPSFVLDRVVRQASRADPEDLLRRHAAFVEAEAGVRGGGVPPRVALDRLVLALAG